MQIVKLKNYVHREDGRGSFLGIINHGTWQEVNYVKTNAGAVRGNHYHKELREIVFVLKGVVEIEFRDVQHPEQRTVFRLQEGEGVEIMPYILHTMRYLTDCEQISLLDQPFNPSKPDLHSLSL